MPADPTQDLIATSPGDTAAADPFGDQLRRLARELPEPPPGYELLGELGRGGMGVVYKARQVALNRTVALKMVLTGEHADARERARFVAEAAAVAAVRHPHVVQVFECGEVGGRPYFAMEYLDGGSLADVLRTADPLAPRDAAALLLRIARGVAAAHDLGIVHRDLKPANVLLAGVGGQDSGFRGEESAGGSGSPRIPNPDPRPLLPKVADFGLAKAAHSDLTRTGAVVGTPAYMAPEQAAGRTKFVGPEADVYSLGVILYELLAGRVPFRADDTFALLRMVVEDDPPPLRALAPHVPRDLDAVCRRCLQKDPHARYRTAAELADDLRRFLDGETVAARSAGLFGRVAGVLGRSLKEAEFAAYGSVMFGFAAVTLAAEAAVTLVVFGVLPLAAGMACQYARLVAYLAILWVARRGAILPRTAAERQLWSVVGGYVVACTGTALALRLNLGWGYEVEPLLYQVFAGLAALTFFALGSMFWGGSYVFGLVFLAAAATMAIDLRFAPLTFGLTWAAVLAVIGVRLRRLGAGRAAGLALPRGPD